MLSLQTSREGLQSSEPNSREMRLGALAAYELLGFHGLSAPARIAWATAEEGSFDNMSRQNGCARWRISVKPRESAAAARRGLAYKIGFPTAAVNP